MQIGPTQPAVSLSAGDAAMMAAGVAVLLAGGWVLLRFRSKQGPRGPRLAPSEEALIEPPRPLTEPTRLTIALVLLIAGYHLIVWALPRHLVGVQFSRERWYVWVLVGAVAVALSVAIDRFEKARDAGRGESP